MVDFADKLMHSSIDPDGSDFRVMVDNDNGGLRDISIGRADWYGRSNINDKVFLYLLEDLPSGSTPVIRVIGEIKDKTGHTLDTIEPSDFPGDQYDI